MPVTDDSYRPSPIDYNPPPPPGFFGGVGVVIGIGVPGIGP
jgi:hypothetical protein